MEPFFLRCETCRARLRVRDERFLGQVQSCPKCGSMVHILAPPADTAPNSDAAVAAAAATTMSARLVAMLRDHALLWSAGAGATLAAGGLVIFLALGSGEDVVPLPPSTSVAVAPVARHIKNDKPQLPPSTKIDTAEQAVTSPPTATPVQRPQPETVPAAVAEAAPKVVAPPQMVSTTVKQPEKPRTLTLEPVNDGAKGISINSATVAARPNYPPATVVEADIVEAKPQAAEPAARVTNVVDQLAVPIESIDLPAMPIGEFVNLLSGMAAVPIEVDAKVLGEVGLSSRSTVAVKANGTTVGKLLASVLQEHHLTCVERDGTLVVVKASVQASR